jgi:hypothetical protein
MWDVSGALAEVASKVPYLTLITELHMVILILGR